MADRTAGEVLPGFERPQSRHGRITALSMMKDEGPYVIEWVAHHLAVGFTDFVVYTNDCSDGTDAMLKRMEAFGFMTHRRNVIPDGVKPQPSALKHAQIDPEVARSDWLLTFDADEFLCIRHGDGGLEGLIDAIEAEGGNGMAITWRIFGSGGVVDWSRAPVTEQYLMAAPPAWNKGWGVKTLFRFDPEIWKLGIHRPKMKNKVLDTGFPDSVRWLNGSGRPMEEYFKFRGWRSIQRTVGYDWAQMNHYAVKSVDAYAIRRFRGNVNNKADKYNAEYWSLQDRNEVRDDAMLRYSERRNGIMAALLSDPELRELHDAAVARAEDALATLKTKDDYPAFVEGLKAAGQVPITQVSAAPPKARDPAKIAAMMSDVERRTVAKRAEELRKPATARDLPPQDLFVRGPVDVTAEVSLDWVTNHTVQLPADPRLFSPAGLAQIESGKFQRHLARLLPGLAGDGTVLELGAACGFLGLHLAQVRGHPGVTLAERDPGWRTALDRVQTVNGAKDVEVADGLEGLPPPETLILGEPGLSAEKVLPSVGPATRQVLLVGRLLVEPEAQGLAAALRAAGFGRDMALDRTVAIGLARG